MDPLENAHPVGGVDHIVPGGELGEAGDLLGTLVLLGLPGLLLDQPPPGDQGEPGVRPVEPGGEGSRRDGDRTLLSGGRVFYIGGGQAGLLQVVGQCPARPFGAGEHHAGPALFEKGGKVLLQQLDPAPPGGKLPDREVYQGFRGDLVAAPGEHVQEHRGDPLGLGQGVLPGFRVLVQALAEQALLQVGGQVLAPLGQGGAHPLLELCPLGKHQQGALRGEIVEEGGRGLVDQGEEFVHGPDVQAFPELFRLGQQHLPGLGGPFAPQRLGQGLDLLHQGGDVPRQDLHAGGQGDGVHRVRAPLGGRVEGGEGVHLVSPELHPHRLLGAGGEKVHDAPPAAELARALDLVLPHIAAAHQGLQQGFYGKALPGLQGEEAALQVLWSHGKLQRRVHTGDHAPAGAVFQPGEGLQPQALVFPGGNRRIPEIHVPQGELDG